MKNLFKKIWWFLLAVIIIVLVLFANFFGLYRIASYFIELAKFIGGGSLIIGLVATPLFVFFVVQSARGVLLVFEKDLNHLGEVFRRGKGDFIIPLYYIATILGCIIMLVHFTSQYEDFRTKSQETQNIETTTYSEDKLNDAYDIGYEDGLRFGIRQSEEIYWDILDDASDCPPEYAEWSVYEAWNNVLLYLEEPEMVSEEDVLSSAMVLAYFCRYLDEFNFETDFNPWEYYY